MGFAPSHTKEKPPRRGLAINHHRFLAVAGDRAHLTRQEMVGRPRTRHDQFTILELLSSRVVTVLIFFDRLGVDEVRDIEQHAVGIDFLATDFFLEGIKKLMHLDGEGAALV